MTGNSTCSASAASSSTTDVVCAGGVLIAFVANSAINASKPGFLSHEAVTIGENLLIGGGGLIRTGLGVAGAISESVLPASKAGQAALNVLFGAPGAAGIPLEGPIDGELFCG